MKNKNSALTISLAVAAAIIGGLSLGYFAGQHKPEISQKISLLTSASDAPYTATNEYGAYLIAQRAEQDSDWPATHRALKNLSVMSELPPEQNARFYLSSIASGDWITARKIAIDHPEAIAQSAPLVRMLNAMMDWSDGQDVRAMKEIATIEYNPISQPVLPFAKGWMTRETPVINIIQAAQDIGFSTLNMVRFLEAAKQYDKSDALMIKFQQAELSVRLQVWSIAYFERRGLTAEATKAQAKLDATIKDLPQNLWQKEKDAVLAEAAGHLKDPKRALALTLIDATEFLEAHNASAIALLYTQMALKLAPDLYGGDLFLASLYDNQDNWDEALEAYRKVGKDNPSYLAAQLRIAAVLGEKGSLEEAKTLYNRLVRDNSDNPEVWFQQGEFLRANMKDYQGAINSYDKVEKLLGGNIPESYWTLFLARGLCHEMLDQPKKAEADYQNALNLQPDNSEALNTLAYSWTEQGTHLEEAKNMLEKALLADPTAAHIIDSYGWVLFKLGEASDATIWLERAASMMPYDSTVNDHLAEAYWAAGRKREARFMWQRALDNAEDEKSAAKIRDKLKRAE